MRIFQGGEIKIKQQDSGRLKISIGIAFKLLMIVGDGNYMKAFDKVRHKELLKTLKYVGRVLE